MFSPLIPFTVEVAADKGSCNLQWCAIHFLAIWYRDMSSPREGSSVNDSIRKTITNKLTEVHRPYIALLHQIHLGFFFPCSAKIWIKLKW